MRKTNDFDFTFDCQEVFRKLLEAFSNPGRAVEITGNAQRMKTSLGAYIAIAVTLIDNETNYCVVGNEVLSELVQQYTYSQAGELEHSSFVFALSDCDGDQISKILTAVPAGTMTEPHTSCIVIVRVEQFESCPGRTIRGPGINGELTAPIGEYAARWLKVRQNLAREYPCGIDLAFMTDCGHILAVPRLVQLVS